MTVEELQIVISAKTDTVRAKIDQLTDKLKGVQPKKTPDLDINTRKAQNQLKKLQADVDRTQEKIDKLNAKMADTYAKQDAIVGKYTGLPSISGMSADETLDYMVGKDPQMQTLNAQLDQMDAKMAPLKAHLSETQAQITAVGNAAEPAAEKTRTLGQSMESAGRGGSYFGRMVKSMLVSMVLYSGMSAMTQAVTAGIQNMVKGNAQANSTMSNLATSALYLKNSIAAALMPAIQAVTPVIEQMADALANVFNNIAMLSARIFNHASTVAIAQRAGVDYAATLDKTGNSASKTNQKVKELQGTVAGFDELNVLNKQTDTSTPASGSSAANNGMPDPGTMFKTVQIPAWVEKIGEITDKFAGVLATIKAHLAEIEAAVAIPLLVIGTILVLTGANIPLGLGLMAAGAISLAAAIAPNWGNMSDALRNELTAITAGLGAFFFTIGLIMTLTGANVPLGIGLMLSGAGSLAVMVAINWNGMKVTLGTVLSGITGVVSGAALALGVLFTLTGADVPLGIGLMLVGAAGLAAAVALNWGGVSNQTRETIATITGIVGGSLLALGTLLTLTGAAPALGIPMMVVGAATLAATIALNWNSMSSSLRTTLTAVTAIVGGAFLALGAILAFTGVGIPLGVALMLAGAGSLAASAALNWNAIRSHVSSALAGVLAVASVAGVAMGLLLCLTGAGIPLGIGLILAGMRGVRAADQISTNPVVQWAKNLMNGVINVFEEGINWIISMIDEIQFTVPDWVWGIGGQTYGVNISPVHIPRLASGGVVRGPTYAMVGEAGDEAVLPLTQNTSWMEPLADKIAEAVKGGGGGSGDIYLTVPIYLDRSGSLIDTITQKVSRGQQGSLRPQAV